jgi:hypothetical protein
MGRPPLALGIWNEMIFEAGGVEQLATLVGLTRHGLNPVFTARHPLPGPSRKLAEIFAREKGIQARLYIHPRDRGFYLVSSADGWWSVPVDGAWADRVPTSRLEGEDWRSIHMLELPFTRLADILREGTKP